ncbi:MAG: IS21 family transposase [Solirubrobacterales bacterium]
MKRAEEVMEILEAYDLAGTLRGAAELAGCDHKTVAHYVSERERAGGGWQRGRRPRPRVDRFAEKIDELVDRSKGKIRADKVHERLLAIGYDGSERTMRRAVAEAKRAWRREHGRRTRPWIPEPGLWMQWDYASGPVIAGRTTSLFCAWLAWSRFRVVLALQDRTMASVVMALDRALRAFGGGPTYALTDNERTVTTDHVCGVAIRNPKIVAASRHYGLTVATCVPADPESKGGSEATVRIAKADLVPTDHNLRREYGSFAELEAACEAFTERVNARVHRITRRRPVEMLADERRRLHRLPELPHTLCFGETRRVSWQSTISVGAAIYSVPSELRDERVWARTDGEQLVVVSADSPEGPREVARHELTTPGRPRISDAHYPPRPQGALKRRPRAFSGAEAEFLRIGEGAERWLTRAAAAGAQRVRRKLAEAVDLAKLHGAEAVDEALCIAADAERFGDGDLASILAHHRSAEVIELRRSAPAPSATQSLQRSTAAWEGFGR